MISICILCITLSFTALHFNKTLTKLDSVVDSANALTKRADLLVKQTSFLVLQAGLTADQLRKASIKESATLDTVNAHLEQTLANVNQFVINADKSQVILANTTNETIKQLQPVIKQSKDTIAEAQKALGDIDTLILNPSIPKTLLAVQESSEATARTMANVDGVSTEVRQAVHSYLHPSWLRSSINWTVKIAKVFAP
jgi:ABC-type transporter Mla subunit MlaD